MSRQACLLKPERCFPVGVLKSAGKRRFERFEMAFRIQAVGARSTTRYFGVLHRHSMERKVSPVVMQQATISERGGDCSDGQWTLFRNLVSNDRSRVTAQRLPLPRHLAIVASRTRGSPTSGAGNWVGKRMTRSGWMVGYSSTIRHGRVARHRAQSRVALVSRRQGSSLLAVAE
jgi:hypothetical protein